MGKKYINVMAKIDEDTSHRLDRVRDKFNFSSNYEIMQCLLTAFLRHADPGGEQDTKKTDEMVSLSKIFEGLENQLQRTAAARPNINQHLTISSAVGIFNVSGSQRRLIRRYDFDENGITSSLNEEDALLAVLEAINPKIAAILREARHNGDILSTVEYLREKLKEDATRDDVGDMFATATNAQAPHYGERTKRKRNTTVNDAT